MDLCELLRNRLHDERTVADRHAVAVEIATGLTCCQVAYSLAETTKAKGPPVAGAVQVAPNAVNGPLKLPAVVSHVASPELGALALYQSTILCPPVVVVVSAGWSRSTPESRMAIHSRSIATSLRGCLGERMGHRLPMMIGWLSRLWQHPSATLLAVQLIGVLLYPFMDGSPIGRATLSSFGLVVLFLAVRAVQATSALTWIAVLLGLPIVVLTILEVVDPLNAQVVLASSVLHAVFYFYTSVGLLRYMFRDRFVTRDELWATGATFTVVAWAFAYTFMAIQVIWPGSFTAAIGAGDSRTWFELLFLSFTNLTSVGLSDIVPVLPVARSWVMIEQVAGILYVALVISRIVGLTIARQRA